MMKFAAWITNPTTIVMVEVLAVIAIIAVILFLDKKQQEQIDFIKELEEMNRGMIIAICKELDIPYSQIWEEAYKELHK